MTRSSPAFRSADTTFNRIPRAVGGCPSGHNASVSSLIDMPLPALSSRKPRVAGG
ncbi:hypothetical protein [Lentzea nigeriaca]|uniref:hypothetical protein n=1 Tax=Lentzea nigeriaca TaxID=1128665 RepID=UPI00195C5037|nr:hypothetical protein [Lentzea nigeriaca]MBM7864467.1 hypothetical protein [Lentzea nigeriaca]